MKSRFYAALALVAAVAIGAGWYFGSPRWTLHEMQAAAEAKDADKLAGYIDFPALRASLKDQMKAKMAAEMIKAKDDNPFAALGAAFAVNMVEGMVEALVTPAAMREVFANAPEPKPGEGKIGVRLKNLEMERVGLSEFRLVNKEDETGASLIFKRDGLSWHLTDIRFAGQS